MPPQILDDEVERLARELAIRRGLSVTDVLLHALRREQATEGQAGEPAGLAAALLAIGERYSALPTLDHRGDEEILGYDDADQAH
jgi:antitoxin VapB